jgi:NAD(P)-dependent dehydrogenase (short-subunit alcohol dehydrogenase family)
VILVTGATGYVGGRLVPRLVEAGHRVRVLARDPARLAGRPWLGQVEVVRGDVLAPETLAAAMQGVRVAYYLVHSMGDTEAFHERDLAAAGTSPGRRATPGSRGSSTWEAWATPAAGSRTTCARVRPPETACAMAACRSPSFAPPSSSARAASPSR